MRSVDDIQALHGLVEMEIDGSLPQIEDQGDLGGRLPAAGPGQHFPFPAGQMAERVAALPAWTRAETMLHHDSQHLEVDRLREIVIRALAARGDLGAAIVESREEHERNPREVRGG